MKDPIESLFNTILIAIFMIQELFDNELMSKMKLANQVYFLAITFIVCASITGLYNFFNAYKSYKIFMSLPKFIPEDVKVHSVANIVFLLLYGIMVPIQSFFFYLFASKFHYRFRNDQTQEFSPYLNWLVKQSIVAIILFGINAVWAVIDFLIF